MCPDREDPGGQRLCGDGEQQGSTRDDDDDDDAGEDDGAGGQEAGEDQRPDHDHRGGHPPEAAVRAQESLQWRHSR